MSETAVPEGVKIVAADDVVAKVTQRYADATGLSPHAFVAHAVDGAHQLR